MNTIQICDNAPIAQNIRRLRLAKNITVKQMAKELMLDSLQAYYDYESGRTMPPGDRMMAIMMVLDATVTDLIKPFPTKHDMCEELGSAEPGSSIVLFGQGFNSPLNDSAA